MTDWQPGKQFAMTWHVGRSEAQATDIEVTFDAVADGTQVKLIHSNWHRLGSDATAIRQNYHAGWDMVLGTCFLDASKRVLAPCN